MDPQTARRRAARWFVIIVLAVVTAVCGGFLLSGQQIPEWFVLVGRWIPALVSLLVLRFVPLDGGLARWWDLRPGGWRRLLGGSLLAVLALLGSYALTAGALALTGVVVLQPWNVLGQVAVMLLPSILLFALSTFGEEVGWRGFLQQLLADKGFWKSSSIISAVWVLFHVPLHGTMAIQGVLPWTPAVVATVGLFPLGLFLSAAVVRWGSVWPAVFAHALPFSALNLLLDAGELAVGVQWLVAAVTAAVLLVVTALLVWKEEPRGSQG